MYVYHNVHNLASRFCRDCLNAYWNKAKDGTNLCPSCRLDLEGEIIKANDLLRRMTTNDFVCSACKYRVRTLVLVAV